MSHNQCSLNNSNSSQCSLKPKATNIKASIYEGFVEYFGNIYLNKITSNDERFDMFCACISTMTSQIKYIYVITYPTNVSYGGLVRLSDLQWVSFQTRTSVVNRQLQPQTYPKVSNHILETKIQEIEETKEKISFVAYELPLKVELINSPSFYNSNGTIKEALETFSCVIYFV